jgi:hypothetical protein
MVIGREASSMVSIYYGYKMVEPKEHLNKCSLQIQIPDMTNNLQIMKESNSTMRHAIPYYHKVQHRKLLYRGCKLFTSAMTVAMAFPSGAGKFPAFTSKRPTGSTLDDE